MDFTVSITPTSGAATYTDILGGGTKANGTTYSSLLYSGVGPLSGTTTLGSINFTLPANASAGAAYSAGFTAGEVSYLGNDVSPALDYSSTGSFTVTTALAIASPSPNSALTPQATANGPYSQTFTATGGATPYSWSATGLPSGLTLTTNGNNQGVISGSPSVTGPFNSILVTVKDSESTPVSVQDNYTLVVNSALSNMLPASLSQGTENSAYSVTVSVSGGTGPYTWGATGLPTGLSISNSTTNSATISGTPTVAANGASVKVTVTDVNTASLSTTYSLTISGPLTLSPANSTALPTATVGTAYTTGSTIVAAGGTPPYSFTATGLPGGLTISSTTGAITGTPNANGSFTSIQVKVSDSASASVTNTYTMTVNKAITITFPTSLPNGTVGAPYPPTAITATATGGSGSYTWTMSGLPGVNIGSSTGIVSGTPTTASANDTVTITATDTNNVTATATFTNVGVSQGVSITTPANNATLPGATVSTAYSVGITSTGGTSPFTWSSTGLPGGLTLTGSNGTATINGTPSATGGPTSFTVKVVDANGSVSQVTYTLTVNALPVVGGGPLPIATVSSAYTTVVSNSNVITLTGGTAPITWSATGLPAGLTINSSGVIIGTPTTNSASPYSVNVKVVDLNQATSNQNFTLTVHSAIGILPSTATPLPVGIPSVQYKGVTFTASGGSGSGYTFAAASGLPAGLTLSSAGVLSGTPTVAAAAGSPYTLVVTVTDGIGATASFAYTLGVAPPLVISGTPSSLPAGTVKVAYVTTTLTATGGTPPYSWGATNLPPGLTINTVSNTGVISGTPTAVAGSPFAVTVKVTDQNQTQATANYTIAIGALPLQIITGLLPPGVVNAPYPFTSIQAQGGVGSFSWSITGLPPGLTTDGNGDISGTPTTTTGSPFSVVVTVTDSTLTSTTRTFSLAISGLLTIAVPTTLPAATLNAAYPPVTVTAGGGLPPYTWTATGLPAGMTIGIATGVISGTPTSAAGSPYSATVTVTDSTGKTASMVYTLAVNSTLTISGPASLPSGTVGATYPSTTVTATGGSGVYTWSATGLPSGLTVGSTTGAITGTPAAGTNAGSPYTVVVTVTDSNSNTATKSYSLTINPAAGTAPVIATVSTTAGGQSFVAPNTWVSIYGTNFTPAGFTDNWTNLIKGSSTGALPTILDGVSVMVGGVSAYVEYISATQINVLTPNIGLGPLQVTVTTTAATSNAVSITSQQYIPAFFEWPNASGQTPGDTSQQPVATHSNYSYAVANGTFPGTATVPAKPGETIVLWGAGFGPTTPANPFGVAIPSTSTYNTTNDVTVTINGAPVTVYENIATLSPGSAGLYQVGVTIPSSLANGTYPIVVSINGVTSPTLSLAVHN
jgi:uncharacterized protein (TIGR03437 family)